MPSVATYLLLAVLFSSLHFDLTHEGRKHYEPTWASLDSRPAPVWYDNAKFGIFVHWGPYSVPAFSPGAADRQHSYAEWFWLFWERERVPAFVEYMQATYQRDDPEFEYKDFARLLTAKHFQPDEWASLFSEAGAKYVVLTSKHHDGFTPFPSSVTQKGWTSTTSAARRDLVGLLRDAILRQGIEFGLYYSHYEWFQPLYLWDQRNEFHTRNYVKSKVLPELKYIIHTYRYYSHTLIQCEEALEG